MPDQSPLYIEITKDDVIATYSKYGIEVGTDPTAYSHLFAVMQSFAEGGFLSKFSAAAGVSDYVAGKTSMSQTSKSLVSSTSFVLSQAQLTMALTVLKNATPGKAAAMAGFTVISKVALVNNLLPNDQRTAKCVLAIAQLSGQAGLATLEFSSGIGVPLAILTIGALVATALEVQQSCMDPAKI